MFDCGMMSTVEKNGLQLHEKKRHLFSLGLLILIVFIGVIAYLMMGNSSRGKIATIYINGDIYQEVSLLTNQSFRVETDHGFNEIEILDGQIRVSTSDCANQICVNQGWISKDGSIISCIPHGLVITISTGEEVDTVAY